MEVFDSVVEPDVPSAEELTKVADTPVEKTGDSDVFEYESKENGVKIFPSSDENCNGFSPVETHMVSKGMEETVLTASEENTGESSVQPDENTGESSGIVDLASKENVETILQQPVDVPSVETTNSDEHTDESEIPESVLTKPIISLTPRALQPTSWTSCCGLFDFLRRSDR
ncbi:hypothetical protein L1049_024148 [Liquidambar formosana]|uniref:Uncharacterized protein n=1 Tax=Liquidambar formosana TaxID=63359 RepID=A0AAP0X126_LIQFO